MTESNRSYSRFDIFKLIQHHHKKLESKVNKELNRIQGQLEFELSQKGVGLQRELEGKGGVRACRRIRAASNRVMKREIRNLFKDLLTP